MPKKLLQRHQIVVVALICIIIAGAFLSMKPDGPVGSHITQAMESKAMAEIKNEAVVAVRSVDHTLNQWRHGGEHPQTIKSMQSLVVAHSRNDDNAAAARLARLVLATKIAQLGPDDPQTLDAQNDLAMILMRLKDYPSAEDHQRKSLEGWRRTLGEANWTTASAAYWLSEALDAQETKPEEALAVAEMALSGFLHDPNPQ